MELLPSFRKLKKQKKLVYKVAGYNRPYVFLFMPLIIAVGILLIVNNRLLAFQPATLVAEAVVLIIFALLYFKFIHNNVLNGRFLLMLDEGGLYIKPSLRRSTVFQRQVLHAPYHEIKHVQQGRRTVHAQGTFGGEQRTLYYKFLDITFYDGISNLLLKNMIEKSGGTIEDHKKEISKIMECFRGTQITLRNPKTIRIRMDNLSGDVLNATACFQKQRVKIVDDRYEETSYQAQEHRNMEEILAVVAICDDTSVAIRLAQKLYCLDEGEAKQLIMQLKNGVAN